MDKEINKWLCVCANCMDFDKVNNACTIRYQIRSDKSKTPLPRKPMQKGCEVFMSNPLD